VEASLVAPCGMNCGICTGYLRKRKPCMGCAGSDVNKPAGCRKCTVTVCQKRQASVSGFCYECGSFPCRRIRDLDKRYRAKYYMSMIENLEYIRDNGINDFLKWQDEKWKCPECGGTVSCHTGACVNCSAARFIA
jgi:hypothetical protein